MVAAGRGAGGPGTAAYRNRKAAEDQPAHAIPGPLPEGVKPAGAAGVDRGLLAWGLRGRPAPIPRLWLFTDDKRLPDPREAVALLPRGRAGVILRHDADPERLKLGRDLARICRVRRLVLVVAGDIRLARALGAGVHL